MKPYSIKDRNCHLFRCKMHIVGLSYGQLTYKKKQITAMAKRPVTWANIDRSNKWCFTAIKLEMPAIASAIFTLVCAGTELSSLKNVEGFCVTAISELDLTLTDATRKF